MLKECKTCTTNYYCDLLMKGTTDGCPCQTCLIKMICIKTCSRYNEFYKQTFGFPPTDLKGY